ncbi:MAG: mycofactocin-coupled SDR family oxidoreductase [Acidobacteriota bacterium]|nr:mycofactocin-coupled SDR family oxidoreductase [Acidobacteriota bacterium]
MALLEGKVAFITGAARGQGRAHARRLAEEGADIIGVDLCADIDSVKYSLGSEEELQETAELVERTGRRAVTLRADVRRSADLRAAVAAGLAELGHIDIVVANAGIASMGVGPTDEELEESWDDVIAVNLTGVWNTVRACAPAMIERNEGGSIILTSSTAGLKGLTSPGRLGSEAYGASKHGVVGLMRQFAVELSAARIRVNSVHPTGVDTMMIRNPMMEKFLGEFPEAVNNLSNLLPVEVLEPRDASDTVLFLASDLSRYITGVTLPVDAGFTVK